MRILWHVVVNLPEYALVALMVAIQVIVLAEVVFRYALVRSLAWSGEVVVFLLVWMAFIGAAVAVKRRSHFRVELLMRVLSHRGRQILEGFVAAMILVFGAFMAWQGWTVSMATMSHESSAVHVPMGLIYLAIPVSGGLMILYIVLPIFGQVVRRIRGASSRETSQMDLLATGASAGNRQVGVNIRDKVTLGIQVIEEGGNH